MLRRFLIATALVSVPGAARAVPLEFVFTPKKAVAAASGAEIDASAPFDAQNLMRQLPGYRFEMAEEEGSTVWSIFNRTDADGFPEGGLSIVLDYEDPTYIQEIVGGLGVTDAAGATYGVPLVDLYKADSAKCDAGMDYVCESEIAPTISYSVDADGCPNDIDLPSFSNGGETTLLHSCLKVYAILLSREPITRSAPQLPEPASEGEAVTPGVVIVGPAYLSQSGLGALPPLAPEAAPTRGQGGLQPSISRRRQ